MSHPRYLTDKYECWDLYCCGAGVICEGMWIFAAVYCPKMCSCGNCIETLNDGSYKSIYLSSCVSNAICVIIVTLSLLGACLSCSTCTFWQHCTHVVIVTCWFPFCKVTEKSWDKHTTLLTAHLLVWFSILFINHKQLPNTQRRDWFMRQRVGF